jgi:hypothetical protein
LKQSDTKARLRKEEIGMESILILLLTMGMLFSFFHAIWKSRKHLIKYLATVGGDKPAQVQFKPYIWIPFLVIHGIIGIASGYFIFIHETDGRFTFRLLLSFIVAMMFLLMLYGFYFIMTIIIKEIISMKDRTINLILVYSLITAVLLFTQIFSNSIEYPKGFLWISGVLYIVSLYSIGRLIWMIFKKKVLVKSIWSIAILNFSFAVIALSNFVYVIQRVYPEESYSRPINTWGDALYFVVISFFTVGYGDLYPVCETTKILTMFIVLTGFSFTAIFVSAALSATVEHFSNIVKK